MANGHGGPRPGAGRKKGSVNKVNKMLKDAIIEATEAAGLSYEPDAESGMVAYLKRQAIDHPGPFLGLIGKVMPVQLAGADDENGEPTAIQINIVDPRDGSRHS